jgi:serine/threonine protein kinase
MSSDSGAGQRAKDLVDKARAPSATGVLEGRTIGPYQVGPRVGAGGMGEVYKAFDTRLDRTVAIKVLPPHLAADPFGRERFEREARAVAALNHPHISTR